MIRGLLSFFLHFTLHFTPYTYLHLSYGLLCRSHKELPFVQSGDALSVLTVAMEFDLVRCVATGRTDTVSKVKSSVRSRNIVTILSWTGILKFLSSLKPRTHFFFCTTMPINVKWTLHRADTSAVIYGICDSIAVRNTYGHSFINGVALLTLYEQDKRIGNKIQIKSRGR